MTNLGPRSDWAATCELCEWSRTMKNEEEARIICVLHTIENHPLHYAFVTGKDPDWAKHYYKDLFETYRKDL